MTSVRQATFSRGEISPALHARVDLDGYRTGLHTLRNMIVMREGSAQNRSGFKFLAPTKYAATSSRAVRVIPFVFNTDDSNQYALEIGHQYIRFFKNGAQVRKTAANISAITNANPGVVTTGAAHGLLAGEEVYISGVVGMKELNNRWFIVGTVGGGGTTFQLLDRGSNNVNTTNYGTYVSGGTTEEVYEVTTTYDDDDVMELSYAQLNDTMIFAHAGYAPRKLVRTNDTSWALSTISFGPTIGTISVSSGTRGNSGGRVHRYKVSMVSADTGEEGLTGYSRSTSVTGATAANPVVITANSHGLINGDVVYFTSVGGMTQLNTTAEFKYFTVANKTANTFELSGIDGSSYTAYTSGGTVTATHITIDAATEPNPANPNTLTWTVPSSSHTISHYVVYKEINGVYGFVGTSTNNLFYDIGVTPDTSDTPFVYKQQFAVAGDYPSKVCFYQQRLAFANSTNDPNTVWASVINQLYNFNVHQPPQDADSLEFEIIGSRALQIRSMVDMGRLVVFTTEGEYVVNGDQNGALTPYEINPRQVSANGSAIMPAILVNSSALYVQSRSSMVRDLIKTPVQIDGYDGDERSLWSTHLFRGYTVLDSAYQQVPESVAWFVRSDGDMNALTYVREQSMFGWSRHDTQGTFESICSVPEGTEDALYSVVTRTVNGASHRQIERMTTRTIGPDSDDVEDNVFVDSSVSFDGRNTGATTMTITTATTYVAGQTLTLTSSGSYFNADMVGDKINVTAADGDVMHLTITASTSATVMSVTCDENIPSNLQNTARTTWARAMKTLYGMWPLEGLSLSVQGDSFVEANPNDSSLTARTVSGGTVTLGRWYEVIHAGLPYVSDLKTLRVDIADMFNSLTGNMKLVNQVDAQFYRTRGVYAGEDLPSTDSSVLNMTEMVTLASSQSYDSTPALTTDVKSVPISASWNNGGQVALRQRAPLPCTILSLVPKGHLVPRSR